MLPPLIVPLAIDRITNRAGAAKTLSRNDCKRGAECMGHTQRTEAGESASGLPLAGKIKSEFKGILASTELRFRQMPLEKSEMPLQAAPPERHRRRKHRRPQCR